MIWDHECLFPSLIHPTQLASLSVWALCLTRDKFKPQFFKLLSSNQYLYRWRALGEPNGSLGKSKLILSIVSLAFEQQQWRKNITTLTWYCLGGVNNVKNTSTWAIPASGCASQLQQFKMIPVLSYSSLTKVTAPANLVEVNVSTSAAAIQKSQQCKWVDRTVNSDSGGTDQLSLLSHFCKGTYSQGTGKEKTHKTLSSSTASNISLGICIKLKRIGTAMFAKRLLASALIEQVK